MNPDVLYIDGDDQEHMGGVHNVGYNDRIFNTKRFTLVPPAPGYTLNAQLGAVRSQHSGTVVAEVKPTGPAEIEVTMKQGNFEDQPLVELQISTTWDPDLAQQQALKKAYDTEYATSTAEKAALERTAFVKAAKERIKLASQIRQRKFEDLHGVFRRVVRRNSPLPSDFEACPTKESREARDRWVRFRRSSGRYSSSDARRHTAGRELPEARIQRDPRYTTYRVTPTTISGGYK